MLDFYDIFDHYSYYSPMSKFDFDNHIDHILSKLKSELNALSRESIEFVGRENVFKELSTKYSLVIPVLLLKEAETRIAEHQEGHDYGEYYESAKCMIPFEGSEDFFLFRWSSYRDKMRRIKVSVKNNILTVYYDEGIRSHRKIKDNPKAKADIKAYFTDNITYINNILNKLRSDVWVNRKIDKIPLQITDLLNKKTKKEDDEINPFKYL